MKTVLDQLAGYAAYHRDSRNVATHAVGVPMIMFAVLVLLSRPLIDVGGTTLAPVHAVIVAAGLYYLLLDVALGGLLVAVVIALTLPALELAAGPTVTWLAWGIGMFVVGWIIQFVGHYYEGRKPAFFDDVMGLLIGPLFVLAKLVFAVGLRRELHDAIEARMTAAPASGAPAVA